jgi:hypothetical protein
MIRLGAAWRALGREQRYAALTAFGLFLSMFLPWYSKTDTFIEKGAAKAAQTSSDAFQAFSFVEAAVLLVSAGVLAMLFARAERRPFQLPGGDGLIVMIAGGWVALLIFYRLLDKPGVHGNQHITATVGVQWGIFMALLVALGLLYTGMRMRASEQIARSSPRDPLLPNDDPPAARGHAPPEDAGGPAGDDAPAQPSASVARARPGPQTAASAFGARGGPRRRPRYPPAPGEQQMSLDDAPPDST